MQIRPSAPQHSFLFKLMNANDLCHPPPAMTDAYRESLAAEETAEVIDWLWRMALISSESEVHLTPLTGGVASDIWKVEAPEGSFCVKRALAKLRVAADWRAPVESSADEVE
jgi:hypothetical protein